MTLYTDRFSLDATTIKIIAVVFMVVDHTYQMFAPMGAPIWLNWLGRPVMIMFLFVLTESFWHTGSRQKLLVRLLLGAWLMSICNVLMQVWILPNEEVTLFNNAFGAFFVACLYMLFWDLLVEGIKTRRVVKVVGALALCSVPMLTVLPMLWLNNLGVSPYWLYVTLYLGLSLFPSVFLVEGGPIIVGLGVLMYIVRRWRWAQVAWLVAFSVAVFVWFNTPSAQWLMVFAAIPILLYNGQKGRGNKYFFYIFYPAHIYLLYIVATLLLKA
jgi:hypothetical protein